MTKKKTDTKTNTLRITLTTSTIGSQKRHKETVRALGLRKMHQTVEKPDNPSVRGMVALVKHLVTVEEV